MERVCAVERRVTGAAGKQRKSGATTATIAAFREGRLPTVVKWPKPHSWTGEAKETGLVGR